MDEITLVNLLNKICEKNSHLTWKLECKYPGKVAIMNTVLIDKIEKKKSGYIEFQMDDGLVVRGKYKGILLFRKSTFLTDALLDILHYETSRQLTSVN